MKIEPLIIVKDVSLSSRFYQRALGLTSAHGGDENEMLMLDGKLILQLHHRDTHEHSGLWGPDVRAGNG